MKIQYQTNLQELNLFCNKINNIPIKIQYLTNDDSQNVYNHLI
jgi:hypothetical protein